MRQRCIRLPTSTHRRESSIFFCNLAAIDQNRRLTHPTGAENSAEDSSESDDDDDDDDDDVDGPATTRRATRSSKRLVEAVQTIDKRRKKSPRKGRIPRGQSFRPKKRIPPPKTPASSMNRFWRRRSDAPATALSSPLILSCPQIKKRNAYDIFFLGCFRFSFLWSRYRPLADAGRRTRSSTLFPLLKCEAFDRSMCCF